jgi:FAD-dependent monooxygenase
MVRPCRPVQNKLGSGFTLVSFVSADAATQSSLEDFIMTAKKLHVPFKVVNLSDEAHARNVWGADLVLVRPDSFVAWRVDDTHGLAIDAATADRIIRQAVGQGDRAT